MLVHLFNILFRSHHLGGCALELYTKWVTDTSCTEKLLGLSEVLQFAKMYSAASSLPEFCSSSSWILWIRLGCMAALFLLRDSPLSRDYLHDLYLTPVFHSPVSHYRSHCIIAGSPWGNVCQLLGLPFRKNPKLRNARKTFSCRSAPTFFHARFIFLFSVQGTTWIRMFPVINWPYIGWDAHQCLQLPAHCAVQNIHSIWSKSHPWFIKMYSLAGTSKRNELQCGKFVVHLWIILQGKVVKCTPCLVYKVISLSPHTCHVTVVTIYVIRT